MYSSLQFYSSINPLYLVVLICMKICIELQPCGTILASLCASIACIAPVLAITKVCKAYCNGRAVVGTGVKPCTHLWTLSEVATHIRLSKFHANEHWVRGRTHLV